MPLPPIGTVVKERFADIAREFGTPTYVYDADVIRRQYTRLDRALGKREHLVCFAVKANSNLSVLSLLRDEGSGFDVVSEGELRRVLKVGANPRKVVFSGVGKSADELAYAVSSRIRFVNLESESELSALEAAADACGSGARVSIRVNPDLVIDSHPHLATGHRDSKFGVSTATALGMAARIREHPRLELTALHSHVGSNVSDPDMLGAAYRELLSFARALRAEGHDTLRELDLGGGFGVSYSGKYTPLDMERWGAMVEEIVSGEDFSIVVEPGKYLVAECGVLLTRVEHVKGDDGRCFAVVDAGMNDLTRPAMYDAYHRIEPVAASASGTLVRTDIVGPVCESGCFLGKGRELPPLVRGDLLAVYDAGAYGFSMASNYNSRRLPAEVLVDGGHVRLVRKRQEWDSLWADELVTG